MNSKYYFSGLYASLLVLLSAAALVKGAAQTPLPNTSVKEIDLRPIPGNPSLLLNEVNGVTYSTGSSIGSAPASSFQPYGVPSQPAIQPGTINLSGPDNSLESGFTVAVGLAPVAQATVTTVFTLVDGAVGSNSLLFAVLRDGNGRWWTGKRRDAPNGTTTFTWYAQKLWDPVSPCVAKTCATDTIYVSFQTNGQIQLDEVATFKANVNSAATDQYDWESGLLNFGLPQKGYNSTTWALDTAPVALPQNVGLAGIQLTSLPSSRFSSPPILSQSNYPAAIINRLAVWANNNPNPGIGVIGNAGILADQAYLNQTLLIPGNNWLPCTSGQFEQPKGSSTVMTTQYDPTQLPTPCNVPAAPRGLAYFATGTSAVINFGAPAFLGAALPGQYPSIAEYSIVAHPSVSGGTSCAVLSSGGSCNVSGLAPNISYSFTVSARGTAGRSTTQVGWSPGAYIQGSTPPNPPGNVVATSGIGSITATWQAPSNAGQTTVTGYTVVLSNNGLTVTSQTVGANVLTKTFNNLSPLGTYSVSIVANGIQGKSFSVSSSGVQPGMPNWTVCASENTRCGPAYGDPIAYGVNVSGTSPSGSRYYRTNNSNAYGWTPCQNSVFGDPAVGSGKSCSTTSAASVPVGPDGYTFCAYEGGTCYAPYNAAYAYGAKIDLPNSSNIIGFTTNLSGGTTQACNPTSFALDPDYGYNKACFVKLPPSTTVTGLSVSAGPGTLTANWGGTQSTYLVSVFNEGASLSSTQVTGRSVIVPNLVPGSNYIVDVTPLSGDLGQISDIVKPNGVTWSACSAEGGNCNVSSGSVFRFSSSAQNTAGAYFNLTDSGVSVPCTTYMFGDPQVGIGKNCYSALSSQLPVSSNGAFIAAGYTFCAYDGGTCFVPSGTTAQYGVNGHGWQTKSVSGPTSFTCGAAAFGNVDPSPGLMKSCFFSNNTLAPGAMAPYKSACTFSLEGYYLTYEWPATPKAIEYKIEGQNAYGFTQWTQKTTSLYLSFNSPFGDPVGFFVFTPLGFGGTQGPSVSLNNPSLCTN